MIQTFSATLTEKKQLTPDVYSFVFSAPQVSIDFKAGQYLIVHVPPDSESTLPYRRLYSICSSPVNKNEFLLLVKMLPGGKASQYLKNMNVGEAATLQGPAGMFTLKDTPRHKIYLATGTGIAPMISMLQYQADTLHDSLVKNILLWGLPTFDDVYFVDSLTHMKNTLPDFDFSICISRDTVEGRDRPDISCFMSGRITTAFDSLSPEIIANAEFYICGNQDMVEAMRSYLKEKGIPPEHVSFERFN